MTKDQLIESVKKSCNGDDIFKRLTGDVLMQLSKVSRRPLKKTNAFPTRVLGPFW